MLNKIKYHTRNLIIAILSIPSTVIAIIRFKVSFRKHKNDSDTSIGLLVDELNSGGLENIVMGLYKGYRSNSINSYILITNNKISNYIDELEDDPRQFQILYSNKARLLNYCRINKIYTIHYHFSTFAMRLVHSLGIKTIYTVHNTYVWFTPKMWRNLKRNLKKCDHIVAVSDFAKEFFEKKTNFNNIITINNGVDIAQLKKNLNNNKNEQTKALYNIKPDTKVIAMVSSFSEQKYHLSLIGAMETAFKKNLCDHEKTMIIMCGPIIDKIIFKKVRQAIKKSPYSKNFIVEKPINPPEIGAFLQNVPDIVVLPSLYEGGVPPLLIIEALICNKPVIMTDLNISDSPFAKYIQVVPQACNDLSTLDVKGIRKIVYSKKSSNCNALAVTISKVINDSKKYAPNLPSNILSDLDVHTMTKKYLSLIR